MSHINHNAFQEHVSDPPRNAWKGRLALRRRDSSHGSLGVTKDGIYSHIAHRQVMAKRAEHLEIDMHGHIAPVEFDNHGNEIFDGKPFHSESLDTPMHVIDETPEHIAVRRNST